MALQKKKFNTKYGLEINDAYVKIRHIQGNKTNWVISVEVYANKQVADACMESNIGFLEVYNIRVPDIDLEKNIYKQTYDYLKTLDKFNDCIDV